MIQLDELAKTLIELPRSQYANLIKKVDAERWQAVEARESESEPRADMTEAEFAEWMARQHFLIDKGICRIFYLPDGAPAGEVRLLEVNNSTNLPEDAPVLALDFMPDIEGIHYTLLVADVTPRQFEGIENHSVPLPLGWTMDGAKEIAWTEE